MTMIPGISVQKDREGKITHITIEVEQQQELARPVLDKIAGEKSKFREDFEKAIPIEESRFTTVEFIRQYYENKH